MGVRSSAESFSPLFFPEVKRRPGSISTQYKRMFKNSFHFVYRVSYSSLCPDSTSNIDSSGILGFLMQVTVHATNKSLLSSISRILRLMLAPGARCDAR